MLYFAFVQREQADSVDEGVFEQFDQQSLYDCSRVAVNSRLQRDFARSSAGQPTSASAHAPQDGQGEPNSQLEIVSGWLKMTDMKLEDKIIYGLKIDYITMQCAIPFKTTAEYKSQQRGKLYRPPVIVE